MRRWQRRNWKRSIELLPHTQHILEACSLKVWMRWVLPQRIKKQIVGLLVCWISRSLRTVVVTFLNIESAFRLAPLREVVKARCITILRRDRLNTGRPDTSTFTQMKVATSDAPTKIAQPMPKTLHAAAVFCQPSMASPKGNRI